MKPSFRMHAGSRKTWLAAAVVATAGASSASAAAQELVPNPESQYSAITSWWDTSRSTQFVAYASREDDVVVLSCGGSGCWTVSVVDPIPNVLLGGLDSTSPLVPFGGGSQLTGYFDGSVGHIYFIGWELNPNSLQYQNVGDLWEAHIDTGGHWSGESLTAATHASTQPWNGRGMGNTPHLMSSLSSMYVQNNQHVFYSGANDSRIHDTYFDTSWHDVPVTPNFGGPPFMGLDLTSFYDGFLHVYASGTEYYSSCDSCSWSPGTAPDVRGYVFGETHDGVEGFYGAADDEDLADYYFMGGWYTSEEYSPNYDSASPVLAYEDNSPISPRVFYVGGDQHVHQMWDREDIMDETGATLVAMGGDDALSPISGYFDGVNDHVFYIGVDQHVHELYMSSGALSGGWSLNDLTASAGATAANELPSLP